MSEPELNFVQQKRLGIIFLPFNLISERPALAKMIQNHILIISAQEVPSSEGIRYVGYSSRFSPLIPNEDNPDETTVPKYAIRIKGQHIDFFRETSITDENGVPFLVETEYNRRD